MGDKKQGLIWSGINILSLAGTIGMYSNYQNRSRDFSELNDNYAIFAGSLEEFDALREERLIAKDKKDSAKIFLYSFGAIRLGVIAVNYFTFNPTKDHNYSSKRKVSGGINAKGHIFINYRF